MQLFSSGLALAYLVSGLSLLATPASATSHPACRPAPAIQTELETSTPLALIGAGSDCDPFQPCWQENIERVRLLAERSPDNPHVHMALQDLVLFSLDGYSDELRATYAAAFEAAPDDMTARYLHARMLPRDERIPALQEVLQLDPDWPWAHYDLAVALGRVEDRTSQSEARPEDAKRHYAEFRRLCPERFQEALFLLQRSLHDAEVRRAELPALRRLVQSAELDDQIRNWPRLWQLSFAAYPVPEHAALRETLREDLAALESRLTGLSTDRTTEQSWESLMAGYEMLDPEALPDVRRRAAQALPCSRLADDLRVEPWLQGNRHLNIRALSQQERRDLFQQTQAWIALCPNNFGLRQARFGALRAGLHSELSDAELLSEIETMVRHWKPGQGQSQLLFPGRPMEEAAALLLERELQPERVLVLSRQVEEDVAHEKRMDLSRLPEPIRQTLDYDREMRALRLHELRIGAFLQLDRLDAARQELELFRAASLATQAGAPEQHREDVVAYHESWLYRLRARLAEHQTQYADAFAFYQQAQELYDDAADEASLQRLWARMGGSEAGLSLLRNVDAKVDDTDGPGRRVSETASPWNKSDEVLSAFTLTDVTGRTWTRQDLDGKVVLVNLWATWCAPCVQELPLIQELHQRTADNPNVLVLTLNADTNTALVMPFLSQNSFAFPVLLASSYLDEQLEEVILPQNWLVSQSGEIRWIQTGGVQDEEAWMHEILARLTELSAESASGSDRDSRLEGD